MVDSRITTVVWIQHLMVRYPGTKSSSFIHIVRNTLGDNKWIPNTLFIFEPDTEVDRENDSEGVSAGYAPIPRNIGIKHYRFARPTAKTWWDGVRRVPKRAVTMYQDDAFLKLAEIQCLGATKKLEYFSAVVDQPQYIFWARFDRNKPGLSSTIAEEAFCMDGAPGFVAHKITKRLPSRHINSSVKSGPGCMHSIRNEFQDI